MAAAARATRSLPPSPLRRPPSPIWRGPPPPASSRCRRPTTYTPPPPKGCPHAVAAQEVAGRSLWQDALARLARNRAAVVSLALLAVIALMAVLAPWISPHPFDEVFWDDVRTPPDFAKAHWFGTDANGRDLFARTLYGGHVSLLVGVAATTVSLLIGVTYGAIAGYFGGRIDGLMMRLVDVLYSLPFLFFVILLMVVFCP